MARGTKAFWDNDKQKKKAFLVCRRNGVDYQNPEIRWALRDYYRIIGGYYEPGSDWFRRKYGWSGIGPAPDWIKNKEIPPPDIALDPNAEDPPTFEQISKYRIQDFAGKIGDGIGRPPGPELWDCKTQKDRIYAYVRDHHSADFDWNNRQDLLRLREMDRNKYGFYNSGGEGFGIPHNLSPLEISIAKRLRDLQKTIAGNAKQNKQGSGNNPLLEARPQAKHTKSYSTEPRSDPTFGPAAIVDMIKQNQGRMTNVQNAPPVPDKPPMKDLVPWGSLPGEDGTFASWYAEMINPTFGSEWKPADPLGKLHYIWSDELESDDMLLMIKPRDHRKTTLISIGYTIWNICERLLYPVLIICLADANVNEIWEKIREHLTSNPKILERYGYLIDDDAPSSQDAGFRTQFQPKGQKNPACFCATWNSHKVMGSHPQLVICDDIQDKPWVQSTMRDAIQLLDANLIPALGTTGKIIIVGTLKGAGPANDIYLYMAGKEIFSVYIDPAVFEVDKDGNAIYEGLDFGGRPKKKAIAPSIKNIHWHKEPKPKIDPRNGNVVINKVTGNPVMKKEIVIDSIDEEWKYRTIYPEVYGLRELCRKRLQQKDPRTGRGMTDEFFNSEYELCPYNPAGVYFPHERVILIGGKGCPYSSMEMLMECIRKDNVSTFLSVDPGGKGQHGITVSVFCMIEGRFYLLQCVVIRAGVMAAAMVITDLLIQYNVLTWGAEGNFQQKETYGDPLDEAIYGMLKTKGYARYSKPVIFNTKGPKDLRISEQIGAIVGVEGSGEVKFFVNGDATDYTQFDQEVRQFPEVPSQTAMAHEFDILDSIACGLIYVMTSAFVLVWDAEYASNPLSPSQEDNTYF